MSNDNKFIPGLIVKAPNERAPEYVKAKFSIRNAELVAFLQAQIAAGEEWTNADVKVSQGGKWYCAIDDWKPNGSAARDEGRGHKPNTGPRPASRDAAPAGFADDEINF